MKKILIPFLSVIILISSYYAFYPSIQVNSNLTQFQNDKDTQELQEYIQFLSQYNKPYLQDSNEIVNRYDIFKKNLYKVQSHNSQPDVPFKLAINQFSDISEKEFIQTFTQPIQISQSSKQMSRNLITLENPPNTDWVKKGYVTIPMEQKKGCQSGWAFAVASSLESLAVISNFDSTLQQYSIQQLIDCDTKNQGCNTREYDVFEAFNYTRKHGISKIKDYPYIGIPRACNLTKPHFKNLWMQAHAYVSNVELMNLVSHQPVVATFFVVPLLQTFSHGILTEKYLSCSDPYQIPNHYVLIVGFGDVEATDKVKGQCQKYWIVRNSWGRKWGENGFFKLCMENDLLDPYNRFSGTCLINKRVTIPTMEYDETYHDIFEDGDSEDETDQFLK